MAIDESSVGSAAGSAAASPPVRRIAHLDMDAFYASVELLRYPELVGQPVVIGGRSVDAPAVLEDGTRQFARLRDYVGRGVVTTSTYAARALGVFSAMGIMKAAKLAPDAILLPVNFDAYRHYSRLFKAAVASIAPQIEDRGIDEIYIDLDGLEDDTLALAQRIKQAVRDATGLSCSIGVTPNKLLSKICSDLEKPDGLTLLGMADIPTRIWPLAVRKVNGIGPKATLKLAALGIETIGQLAQAEPSLLQTHFGLSTASWLMQVAQGIDERPLSFGGEPKSISRETTFARDLHARQDREELSGILIALCERLADDLQRKGYLSRTIGITLRYDDFRRVTRDLTLPVATADSAAILQAARECLKRAPLQQRLRLLGIRAGALVHRDAAEASQPRPMQQQLLL
ncbi:DNA polymerase IV [Herbaspirillum sp. RTI4]|uniref:DNA polymerase IV n=1 Tax=Herbaspirillum sp. RTI4 TaxID=3048640 RepID=UPI002AB43A34|nr:DNA polymerase IV [Herbaspirillum sp. RTI4]MDY7576957.1 DNA polymerase IV [Herbaspirillum sp. RTI4]MEA9982141.1 DNA polymerase IV [Herbaspirillum sp. RTI4]